MIFKGVGADMLIELGSKENGSEDFAKKIFNTLILEGFKGEIDKDNDFVFSRNDCVFVATLMSNDKKHFVEEQPHTIDIYSFHKVSEKFSDILDDYKLLNRLRSDIQKNVTISKVEIKKYDHNDGYVVMFRASLPLFGIVDQCFINSFFSLFCNEVSPWSILTENINIYVDALNEYSEA